VKVLWGVAFGYRYLQTLPRHTVSVAISKRKKFVGITHEAWKNLKTILNRLKVARNTLKRIDSCLWKGEGNVQHLLESCSVNYSQQLKLNNKSLSCYIDVTKTYKYSCSSCAYHVFA
jgi:hypothetical protein